MCGIIGYVGTDAALPVLTEGLENLEYRGYDSVGIALTGNELSVHKSEGTIADLKTPDSEAVCGVGHTRWATHGEPSDKNAHPHVDCTSRIAVVHNGIIDNYDSLKKQLSDHRFTSDTDTEVVAHLLEETLNDESLLDTMRTVVDLLEGTFALVVTAAEHDELVVAQADNPLVLGHGSSGNFVASDVTAFVEHTRDVTYLENGDVARITADDTVVYRDGRQVGRETMTVDWGPDDVKKNGFDHYMLKEIHEQPQALRRTIAGRIDDRHRVDLSTSLSEEYVQSLDEVQLVGAGSSYHAGLYAKPLLENLADVRTTVTIASEYEFGAGRTPSRTLVIPISQSGETADTVRALRDATSAGARTLTVTNVVGSTATRESDEVLNVRAGPEISVAATKTFGTQATMLSLLALHLGRLRNTSASKDLRRLVRDLRRLPDAVQGMLDMSHQIRMVAEQFADHDSFFFIGRGRDVAVAMEGALKLKEIAYIPSEGLPAGELKHGTLSLVTEETPVLAVVTDSSHRGDTLHNIKEVGSRNAPTCGITSAVGASNHLNFNVEVPELGLFEPIIATVGLQLFAYHVAKTLDRPVDKPRNLAKSITVR